MVYEELKKAARSPIGAKAGSSGELSSAEISVMGAASKLVASIATYPSQVCMAFLFYLSASRGISCPSLCTCYCAVLRRDWDIVQPSVNTLLQSLFSGDESKMLCPGMQVVRSRIQQRQDVYRGVRYESSWRSVQVILRREGVRGLYKGLVPNVLRVMPQSAITFLVYEKVMQLLEKHITSEHDR